MSKHLENLMQQVQQMQGKMSQVEENLSKKEISLTSGEGILEIKINGSQEILELKLDPERVKESDCETLEEAIKLGLIKPLKSLEKLCPIK